MARPRNSRSGLQSLQLSRPRNRNRRSSLHLWSVRGGNAALVFDGCGPDVVCEGCGVERVFLPGFPSPNSDLMSKGVLTADFIILARFIKLLEVSSDPNLNVIILWPR